MLSGPSVTYDLYRDLELRPPCTVEDVTRAYKKLALKHHPDKARGSAEQFQKIKKAHEILKDPLKKKYYDKFGDQGLGIISPEGSESMFAGGASTSMSRIIINILIRPTLLVPIFMFIALIGIIFVTFLSRLDRKLYFSDFKTTQWYYIFALLWFIIVIALILESFFLYSQFKLAKVTAERVFEFEEYQNIPAPRKRFLQVVYAMKSIIYAFQVLFGTLLFLYSTVLLAFNMDDNGNLMNGLSWSKIFFPAVFFFSCFGVVKNILYFFSILQYNHPDRMWKQRFLIISNELFATISSIFFFNYFGQWLDSKERNQMTLFLIFSLIYLRIIFNGFRVRCETKWMTEDEIKKFLQRNPSTGPREAFEREIKRNRKSLALFNYGLSIIIGLSIGLIHSHFSCQWPKTWSAAFFPVLLCVYTSIVVFGCCCPCMVFCMELVSPPNSFNTFVPAAGEEQVTIIEISSFYRFGYGFAPIQRRLTHPRQQQ